jgi:hypothetical protein
MKENQEKRDEDHRMDRAIAARQANPCLSLHKSLLAGGFVFSENKKDMNTETNAETTCKSGDISQSSRARRARMIGGIYDSDNILLSCRKAQLSKRLRLLATKINVNTKNNTKNNTNSDNNTKNNKQKNMVQPDNNQKLCEILHARRRKRRKRPRVQDAVGIDSGTGTDTSTVPGDTNDEKNDANNDDSNDDSNDDNDKTPANIITAPEVERIMGSFNKPKTPNSVPACGNPTSNVTSKITLNATSNTTSRTTFADLQDSIKRMRVLKEQQSSLDKQIEELILSSSSLIEKKPVQFKRLVTSIKSVNTLNTLHNLNTADAYPTTAPSTEERPLTISLRQDATAETNNALPAFVSSLSLDEKTQSDLIRILMILKQR